MKGGDTLGYLNHGKEFVFQISSDDEKLVVNDVCVHTGLKLPLPLSFLHHIYGMGKVVSSITDCHIHLLS